MTTDISIQAKQELKDFFNAVWWLTVIRGIALIVLGVLVFSRPDITLIVLTQFLGIYFLIDGIVALIAGIMNRTDARAWTIIRGIIGIAAGAIIMFNPLSSALGLATFGVVLLGISSLIQGIFESVEAIRYRKIIERAWLVILGGVLSIIFGIILLSAPFIMGLVLLRILAIYMIVFGVVICFLAFRVRGALS